MTGNLFNSRWRRAVAVSALLLVAGELTLGRAAAPARTNAAPRQTQYSDFKIIADRNIFNPRRYARSGSRSERRDTRSVRTVDSFTLLGTMNSEKGPLAFFDGSRSEYRKAAEPGARVGQFKVVVIEPSYVELAAGTNLQKLQVGYQLRKDEEGSWHATAAVEPVAAHYTPPSTYTRTTSSYSPPAPPPPSTNEAPPLVVFDPNGAPPPFAPPPPEFQTPPANGEAQVGSSESDVLRRLMQRREQEINR